MLSLLFLPLTCLTQVEPTDYPASMEVDSYSGKSGVTGSVAGYKGNIRLVWTGEGKMMREEGTKGGGVFRSDIAIWVGPLTLVPHLVMSLELSEGEGGKEDEVKVLLDYVSREDLQYTTGNNHLTEYFAGPAREVSGRGRKSWSDGEGGREGGREGEILKEMRCVCFSLHVQ